MIDEKVLRFLSASFSKLSISRDWQAKSCRFTAAPNPSLEGTYWITERKQSEEEQVIKKVLQLLTFLSPKLVCLLMLLLPAFFFAQSFQQTRESQKFPRHPRPSYHPWQHLQHLSRLGDSLEER